MTAVRGAAGPGDAEPGPRELFEVFYPRLAGWTARLVEDRDVAHEIATEAFVRLLPRWGTVHDPRAWLFMTAGNLARDHWRRQGRERAAYRRLGTPDDTVPAVDVATRVTVRRLVEELPDRMRLPVLLHYYADLPLSQVAALMQVAEGTVKRALFDARALMARQLQEVRP
jgi:RNA polymerase sigma-70 factor (ECF subfamily)